MAYIWKFGKAPDYLTAIRDTLMISKEVASMLTKGDYIVKKNVVLGYAIRTNKQVSKGTILKYDTLNDTIGVPLVNKKVLNILERECAGKFQAIPSIIKLPDGTEISDYWIINVINKVPIASLEDCVLSEREKERNEPIGPWTFFNKKAFRALIVEENDLCRDNIIGSNLIFISERLHSIFKKEKIKGGGFYKSLRDSVVFV